MIAVSLVNVVLTNLGSFALGLMVMKWLTRRTAAVVVDHAHDHSEVTVDAQKTQTVRARIAIFIVLGLILFLLGVRVGYSLLARDVSCFNEYAAQSADAQNRRSDATQALQDADKRFKRADREFKEAVVAALTPGASDREVRAVRIAAQQSQSAAQESLDKQAELEAERRRNPYPDPPSEVC